jgi:hypothetical protein
VSTGVATPADRFGNPLADGLPYARGEILRTTADDHAKLERASANAAARRCLLGAAHNPEVAGSNPAPAIGERPAAAGLSFQSLSRSARLRNH